MFINFILVISRECPSILLLRLSFQVHRILINVTLLNWAICLILVRLHYILSISLLLFSQTFLDGSLDHRIFQIVDLVNSSWSNYYRLCACSLNSTRELLHFYRLLHFIVAVVIILLLFVFDWIYKKFFSA